MALNEQQAIEALNGEPVGNAVLDAMLRCGKSRETLKAFTTVAASCGFTGFSYILLGNTLGEPKIVKHWTTAGSRWVSRYSQRRYHLVDPRIALTRDRSMPVIWNGATRASDPRLRAFLFDAEQHSIRGGVAWSIYDAQIGQVVMAWDSDRRTDDGTLASSLRGKLGNLVMLAALLHEIVSARARSDGRRRATRQLTRRESECVALGARGMTSADISVKLGITERTANFHFGNVISKLGALNRSEAIAKAVAFHLVSLG